VVTNADLDGPADRDAIHDCLLAAFDSGDGVRVDVQLGSVEGDPILYRYTVVGRRLVEARTDTTRDPSGHEQWSPSAAPA
jgi:hypothetical protein